MRIRAHTRTIEDIQSHFDQPTFYMSPHPAAADEDKDTDTDTNDEQQNLPQCRICLDGPDPDLGRLIRPCLCSGTVSVRANVLLRLLRCARAKTHLVISLFERNSTYTSLVFSDGGTPRQTPRPSSSVRNVTTVIALLAPRLSASPPTQVRPLTIPQRPPLFFFFLAIFRKKMISHLPPPLFLFSSRDCHSIHNPVHDHSLRVVFPGNHGPLLVGRPVLQFLL